MGNTPALVGIDDDTGNYRGLRPSDLAGQFAGWSITGFGDNAEVLLSRSPTAGKRHYITHLSGSFGTMANVELTLESPSGTVLARFRTGGAGGVLLPLPVPLRLEENTGVVLRLPSGGVANHGVATLMGYTV